MVMTTTIIHVREEDAYLDLRSHFLWMGWFLHHRIRKFEAVVGGSANIQNPDDEEAQSAARTSAEPQVLVAFRG